MSFEEDRVVEREAVMSSDVHEHAIAVTSEDVPVEQQVLADL
jgi:hypothetical protein